MSAWSPKHSPAAGRPEHETDRPAPRSLTHACGRKRSSGARSARHPLVAIASRGLSGKVGNEYDRPHRRALRVAESSVAAACHGIGAEQDSRDVRSRACSTGHSSSHGEVVTASHQHRQSEQQPRDHCSHACNKARRQLTPRWHACLGSAESAHPKGHAGCPVLATGATVGAGLVETGLCASAGVRRWGHPRGPICPQAEAPRARQNRPESAARS